MEVLLNLDFTNPKSAIFNIGIILFIGLGIISGYKHGFLESSVRFLGTIAALVGAFILKNPISVFLYKHFPFFKFAGLFKGVSVINILVYEVIAFLLVFSILMIAIKIICKVTGLVDRLLSFIFLLGIPNKILGAIIGFLQSIITIYFVVYIFKFGCNLFGYQLQPSLADDIINIPVLKDTCSPVLKAFDEISGLAHSYKNTSNKEEYNAKSLDILLKYEVITKENASYLVKHDKIKVDSNHELYK